MLDLAIALRAQKRVIALVSRYSKTRFGMFVNGMAALCTLMRLYPSEVEYNRALWINMCL